MNGNRDVCKLLGPNLPDAFWTAVASEARHRFGEGVARFWMQHPLRKRRRRCRFASAVQDAASARFCTKESVAGYLRQFTYKSW